MIKLRNILNEGGLLQDYEDIVGQNWTNFAKNYLKLNDKYIIKQAKGIYVGYKKGTKIAHWKYDEVQGRLFIDDKSVARNVYMGRGKSDMFESINEVKHIDIVFTDRGKYYKTKFDGKTASRPDVEKTLKSLLGYDLDLNVANDAKLDKAIKALSKSKVKLTWSDDFDAS